MTALQGSLFSDYELRSTDDILREHHYLGPIARSSYTYRDADGILLFGNPTSRYLPSRRWLELIRWCIIGGHNAGSRQWASAVRWLRSECPDVTTVVSYSDPDVGHTGALYRASNWLWAPTWMRLREPPSRGGHWKAGAPIGSVKDRWVFLLQPDPERQSLLSVHDDALMRRMPWASYVEPTWNGTHHHSGGGDYRRWLSTKDQS